MIRDNEKTLVPVRYGGLVFVAYTPKRVCRKEPEI